MIDLSFLTEEEQETILAVLKRDAELKKAEEKRIRRLQGTVSDKGQLKYLTGEWFYETKSLRHQDRIHGSEIITASMRHTQRPLTILELSRILPERPSFVSSESKEVFVPSPLSGLIQEPRVRLSSERDQNGNPYEKPQETLKPVLQSPTKQRQNPFNNEPLAPHTCEEKDRQLVGGSVEQTQTPCGEPLPSSDSCISYTTNLKQDHHKDSAVVQNTSVPMPVATNRTVINRSQDSLIEVDGQIGRQTNSAAPRGILKHMSRSSSTDSLCSRLDPQSPESLDCSTEPNTVRDREALSWIDRKQVRFCAAIGRSGVAWQDGTELGEHSLLDMDAVAPHEEESNPYLVNTVNTTPGRPLLRQRQVDLDEDDLGYEKGANLQTQDAGQYQVPGDLCEHCHVELLSPQVSNLVSAEQESGKAVHLETGPEADHHSQAMATDWLTGHSTHQQQLKLPEQSSDKLDMSVEATSDTKPSSNGSNKNSSQAVSPKPRNRLLGKFAKGEAKEKTAELQSAHKEEMKQKELDDNLKLHRPQSAAHVAEDNQINFACVEQETKTPGTTEARVLQLTALQHTPFKEAMTSLGSDLDTPQESAETKDRTAKFPERLSNLKAFWERENSGPKIIFTREQTRHENIPKTEINDSPNPQNIQIDTIAQNINNNLSPQTELTEHCRIEENSAQCHEEISSAQIESSLLLDLSKGDGTYRANPVLICEETDDSLTGSITDSQIPQPEENNTPLCISLPSNISAQQSDKPVPLPRQSSPQENRPGKIGDPKYFFEYSGPRVIAARVKEASSSPTHSSSGETMQYNNRVVTSPSDLREPLSSREKSEDEVQNSPYSTKTNIVSSTKHVTEKGFVTKSSFKSQLRNSAIIGDVDSTCQQYQGKTEIESILPEERPLSPSRSQTPRSEDSTDDEVRKSPSKTCHPKALPRDSSSPKGSRLEGSPLKTFPIDIAPPTMPHEGQSGRPTPAPRQRHSPSHEAKQSVLMDIKSSAERLQSRKASEPGYIGSALTKRDSSEQKLPGPSKNLGTCTRLARSFIPQDHQHYLGAPENAHLPPFDQEQADKESNMNLSASAPGLDAVRRPQSPLGEFERNQGYGTTEENHSRISSWIVQNTDSNCSQDRTTAAWSQSRASSGSYHDDSSPIRSARLSSKPMPSSKSLENLTSHTREERNKNKPRGELNLSMDDVSALPPAASSLSDTEQMKKMSVSVPVFQHEELDSDSISDNMDWKRNTGSSISNMSLSSGMASMSSVSGSVSSIYHADFGEIEVQGAIQFAVNYIQKLGEFHIFVNNCRDLAVAEPKKNRTDPYVKCYLLPDKTKLGKRKTSVKKKTVNPTYNDILQFKIIMDVLKMQILNISVWHNDTFGRNSFLGEVNLDLSEWDFSNTQINEYALKPRMSAQISLPSPSRSLDKNQTRGQMRVALRFLPQISHNKRMSKMETGEVQIWVKDCKNLPPVRGVIIDPFVKCAVLPDTSRKSRQKTRVVKRTANPMFNHTMVYDGFRPEDLREACIEITVWDHDRLSNHYIGGLRLGLGTGKSYGTEVVWMDSTTNEANLWKRMMQSHGEWVEDVLPLRMLVMAKSTSK